MKMFKAETDARLRVGCNGQVRIDAIALEIYEVSKAAGIFVETINAKCYAAIERLIKVSCESLVGKRTTLEGKFAHPRKAGLFGDPIDHSTAAAAAED